MMFPSAFNRAFAAKKQEEEEQKTLGGNKPALSPRSSWRTFSDNRQAQAERNQNWQNAMAQAQPMTDQQGNVMTPQNQGYVPPTRMDKFKDFLTNAVYMGSPPDPAMANNPLYQDPNKAFWLGLSQDVADSYMGKMPEGAAMRNVNQAFQANTTAPMNFLQQQTAQLQLDQAQQQSAGMANFLKNIEEDPAISDQMKAQIMADPSAYLTGQYTKPGSFASKYGQIEKQVMANYPEFAGNPRAIHEEVMRQIDDGTSTNITLDTGQKETAKTVGGALGELAVADVQDMSERGRGARSAAQTYLRMYDLNPEIASMSDSFIDTVRRNVARFTDLDPDTVAQMGRDDLFNALGAMKTLENTSLLAGAISEAELDLTARISGGDLASTTKEGRQLILAYRMGEELKAAAIYRDFETWYDEEGEKIEAEQGARKMLSAWNQSDYIETHKNVDAFYYVPQRIKDEVLDIYGKAIADSMANSDAMITDGQVELVFLEPKEGSETPVVKGAMYYKTKDNKYKRYEEWLTR